MSDLLKVVFHVLRSLNDWIYGMTSMGRGPRCLAPTPGCQPEPPREGARVRPQPQPQRRHDPKGRFYISSFMENSRKNSCRVDVLWVDIHNHSRFYSLLSTDQCQTFKELSDGERKGRKWNVETVYAVYLTPANSEIKDKRLVPEAKGGSFFYQVQ